MIVFLAACVRPVPPWDQPGEVESVSLPVASIEAGVDAAHPQLVSLGRPLLLDDGVVAPTGTGLVWSDGRSVETPGWASVVVPVGDTLWVADQAAGITVVGADGVVGTAAVGRVPSMALHPAGVVAAEASGRVLLLEPGPDGLPRVVQERAVDGIPRDIAVREGQVAVALSGAGVRAGVRLRLDTVVGSEWASVVSWDGDVVVHGDPGGRVMRGEAIWEVGQRPLDQAGPWTAAGGKGLLRAGEVVRRRPGAGATGVDVAEDGCLVAWSDGVVEQLDANGAVARTWTLGTGGTVSRVTEAGTIQVHPDGRHRWLHPDGRAGSDWERGFHGLVRWGDVVVAPADTAGLLFWRDGVLTAEPGGSPWDLAVTPTGELWYADATRGPVRYPDGAGDGIPAHFITAGPDGVVVIDRQEGLVRIDGQSGFAPGVGRDLHLSNGHVLSAVAQGGIGVARVDALRDWTMVLLPQPWVPWEWTVELCGDDVEVFATLGDLGVARLRWRGDELVPVDRLDTPGAAIDCHLDGDVLRVADSTAVRTLHVR